MIAANNASTQTKSLKAFADYHIDIPRLFPQ
jgi:hypothetical protein